MANYEMRFVAFLDVLGFRELVYASERNDGVLVNLINALHGIEVKTKFKLAGDARRAKFGSSIFSDSIIIYDEMTLNGFFQVLLNVVDIVERLAINGVLCRGAMTCGPLHTSEDKGHVVFGPSLVKAVDMEKLAKFPRVILSAEAYQAGLGYVIDYERGLFDHYISRDADGMAFVNPFGNIDITESKSDWELASGKLDVIADMIMRNLRSTMDNPDHFSKQHWFMDQYNRFVVDMGMPEKEIDPLTAKLRGTSGSTNS